MFQFAENLSNGISLLVWPVQTLVESLLQRRHPATMAAAKKLLVCVSPIATRRVDGICLQCVFWETSLIFFFGSFSGSNE